MKDVKQEIAKNLIELREKNNLNQKELAEKLGVKNNTVSSWEKGTNSIDVEMLFKICTVLSVSINDMFGIYSNIQNISMLPEEFTMLSIFRELNHEGQGKTIAYTEDLVASGNYKKNHSSGTGQETA